MCLILLKRLLSLALFPQFKQLKLNDGISIEKTILDRGNNPGALLRIVSSIETPAFQWFNLVELSLVSFFVSSIQTT
jgi:hypothetical protein